MTAKSGGRPQVQPHHVGISVADLEASIAWYETALGFRLEAVVDVPEDDGRAAMLEQGGFRVELCSSRLDRGGAINTIAPEGLVCKHAAGQATSGFLAEVERVSMAMMEEWKTKYPEAFSREYDPASGLRFNAWVEGGK